MNPHRFQRILMSYLLGAILPGAILAVLLILHGITGHEPVPQSDLHIFGMPLLSIDGSPHDSGRAGPAIVSLGGFAWGVLAIGGTAIGLLGFGGGAVGLVA